MDKLSKLQALLGKGQISTSAESSPWTHYAKPAHIYEGTDSEEDDEDIIRKGRIELSRNSRAPIIKGTLGNNSTMEGIYVSHDRHPTETATYQLEMGQLADEGEHFCPWKAVQKYPYVYIGVANKEKVAKGFWDEGKLFNQTWDFFYIRRPESDANQTPIILIPTKQFEAFLATVNQTLNLHLSIPSGGGGSAFRIAFGNDGTPRPRYLGQSTNKEMADNLQSAVPPSWLKHKDEADEIPDATDRSLAAFKAKVELMVQAQKAKKRASAENKKAERVAKQQSWKNATKRVQRYLGLRQASYEKQLEAARAELAASGFEWGGHNAASKNATSRSADFDPEKPAPYDLESDVVFVCVDVEANEHIPTQITEIGIATLDTRDIKSLVPGVRGTHWTNKIRARHFRINEYKHIINSEFVSGCPHRFLFGESEFVDVKDAPEAVANCFKPPFSHPDENATIDENEPKRKIIFVGHGVGADINYLKSMGYDIHNLSNLLEVVDTAVMWQYLKRELSPRSLASILAEIDIRGWNLHNAGNDAVYTLQAMVGIAIQQLHEREKLQQVKDEEKRARIEESIKEAKQFALDREDGWSSGGEESDGGAPVAPVPPKLKKPIIQQPQKGPQNREGPWRNPAQGAVIASRNQRDNGSWRTTPTSETLSVSSDWLPHPEKSYLALGSTNPGSFSTASWQTPVESQAPQETLKDIADASDKVAPATMLAELVSGQRRRTRTIQTGPHSKDVLDLKTGRRICTIESQPPLES